MPPDPPAAGFCLWLRGFVFGCRFQLRCWFCCRLRILVSVSAPVLVSLLASAFGFDLSSGFGFVAGFGFWFRFLKSAAKSAATSAKSAAKSAAASDESAAASDKSAAGSAKSAAKSAANSAEASEALSSKLPLSSANFRDLGR